MLSAAKKVIGGDMRIEAQFNPEIGEVELFKILTVVPEVTNAELEISLATRAEPGSGSAGRRRTAREACRSPTAASPPRPPSRTSMQRLRDAEREIIYNEFKDRKGELIYSGIVAALREGRTSSSTCGRTDAILPEKEQIPRERYRQGDRIRAFILDVEHERQGPADRLAARIPAS